MEPLNSYFPTLTRLLRQAGEIARKHYRTGFETTLKADRSPVTIADREIELFLREALEKAFPDYSVYGEEFGETHRSGSHRWVIDPIDGTQSFILQTPLFGTLLALERDGVPVLGTIYLPIQDQLMIGSAETGTYLEGKRCTVSSTMRIADARLLITDPAVLSDALCGEAVTRLCKSVRVVRGFGDCYGYFLVASGQADLMLDAVGIQYYDVAAILPIIEGAGGKLTATTGENNLHHGSAMASNGHLHQMALQLLNG